MRIWTNGPRRLDTQTPCSMEEHLGPSLCSNQFLDVREAMYTRPQTSVKTLRPWTKKRLMFLSFPRLSDTLSVLAFSLINFALSSCWLAFDFHPLQSKGPSWLVLGDPSWVPGPSLLAPLIRRQSCEDTERQGESQRKLESEDRVMLP